MYTEAIEALLKKDLRVYIAATGAGAGLQKLLWDVPGISKVLVGAEFPYAQEATDRFLGYTPNSYCSVAAAVSLAMEAYYKAFRPGGAPAVGLGLAASVASNTAHRGAHRVFLATLTDQGCRLYSATLVKGHGPEARKRDGDTSDTLGLRALLEAVRVTDTDVGLPPVLPSIESLLPPIESLEIQTDFSAAALQLLLERPLFTSLGRREMVPTSGNGLSFFPGAFNPPHEAHLWLGREHNAIFHVTVNPPHKAALTVSEVLQRAKLLDGHNRIFTTDDPLYLDKARRFPGARFIVGSDAMVRMMDPKWGPDPIEMMAEFRHLGVRFLVADREQDGRILGLDDIPGVPQDICTRILRPAQHLGLSSTKLREAMG